MLAHRVVRTKKRFSATLLLEAVRPEPAPAPQDTVESAEADRAAPQAQATKFVRAALMVGVAPEPAAALDLVV